MKEECSVNSSSSTDLEESEHKSIESMKSGPIDDYTRLSKKHQQLKKSKKEILPEYKPEIFIGPKENFLKTEMNLKDEGKKVPCEKPRNKKKVKTLPEYATNIMKEWYEAHIDKPYPTESERISMAKRGFFIPLSI